MPVIKIVQSGWSNFTGFYGNIQFLNGVSVANVAQRDFDRIAASFKVEDNATPGVQAGGSSNVISLQKTGVEPNRQAPTIAAAAHSLTLSGLGSPLNVVAAPVGTIYLRQDGGANTTLYVKESGTGTSGWVAK